MLYQEKSGNPDFHIKALFITADIETLQTLTFAVAGS
jgi:hypothetical protein